MNTGEINAELLNNKFEQIFLSPVDIPEEMVLDYYNTTLMDTYKSNDNFFVIIPDTVVNRSRPFELVKNNDEIKKYIEMPELVKNICRIFYYKVSFNFVRFKI